MTARPARPGWLLAAASLAALLSTREWSATLAPVGESMIRGTASVSSVPGDSLALTIQVDGITMTDEFPWHLHAGACGQNGAVLGGASAYPPIKAADDRSGTANARVSVTLAEAAAYSINVHRSSSDQTAIACGNLQPVMGR